MKCKLSKNVQFGVVKLVTKQMIDLLIDKKSLQVDYHLRQRPLTPEGRIGTFLMILRNIGFNPIEENISSIKEEKHNFRGIISLTRYNQAGYTDDELEILHNNKLIDFIAIFANHPPEFTEESNRVAQPYGIEILSEIWKDPSETGHYTRISAGNYNVTINSSCKIKCDSEKYIRIGHLDDDNKYFACYCKKEGFPTALFIADSGFLCESNSNTPGPGLIDKSDNKRFIWHWFKKLKSECKE